jgi:hypothetical protein
MSEENTTKDSLQDLVDAETNRNKKKVKCVRCDSYILQPNSCTFKRLDSFVEVPSMMQKKDLATSNKIENESLNEFWLVNDMHTFENVGFTNSVSDRKYLICADCEIGPIGFQIINTNEFYVCLKRVKHV